MNVFLQSVQISYLKRHGDVLFLKTPWERCVFKNGMLSCYVFENAMRTLRFKNRRGNVAFLKMPWECMAFLKAQRERMVFKV